MCLGLTSGGKGAIFPPLFLLCEREEIADVIVGQHHLPFGNQKRLCRSDALGSRQTGVDRLDESK